MTLLLLAQFDGAAGLPLLGAVLSASLLGSIHCAGMCGPFVAVYSAAGENKSRGGDRMWLSHVAYHGGRAVSYVGLGALAGALGSAIDLAGRAAGFSRVAALICGVLVVLWGISVLFPVLRVRSPVARFFGPQLARLGTKPRVFRASLLGGLAPFLPCGWLYAFVVTAAGTGSAAAGAALMLTFWLGTVPALLGVGAILSRVGDKLRARVPLLTGVALIVIGGLGLFSRMSMPAPTGEKPAHAAGGDMGEGAPCH